MKFNGGGGPGILQCGGNAAAPKKDLEALRVDAARVCKVRRLETRNRALLLQRRDSAAKLQSEVEAARKCERAEGCGSCRVQHFALVWTPPPSACNVFISMCSCVMSMMMMAWRPLTDKID